MVDLASLIQEKNQADTQWKENRQMERENVTALQDAGITQITSDPETYARYLNMQADNYTYSAGNIVLVMMQGSPDVTVFGTAERWRGMGRFVPDGEPGFSIFTRSPNGKGYIIGEAFDLSQTQGREYRPPQQLAENSKGMETAMKVLLNYSLVPPTVNNDLPLPAYYDQKNLKLYIKPGYPDEEAFAAIAAEVAHSRFHQKGYNGDYLRAESDLDAQSISYILCRRFGVQRELPDLSRLPELYQGWTIEGRRQILDGIQDMSKKIGNSIEKNITPQQRTIPQARRPPRPPAR